jgi:GNAT superfamily N-acetyltransferase
MPTPEVLQSACDLFRRNIPVFDEQCGAENEEALKLRGTPEAYAKLLETRTLLLAFDTREAVMGMLEYDERDKQEVMLAFVVWLMVDESVRGRGISSELHRHFERVCVPDAIRRAQKTVYQALAVHLQNPALGIYRKWEYIDAPFQWNDGRRWFLYKEPHQHGE